MNQKAIGPILALLFALISSGAPQLARAQYFQSSSATREVVVATKHDSVLFDRRTHFEIPQVKSEDFALVYHEPQPDSLMPRSAVVLGTVTIQAETSQDIVDYLEEFATERGADWIVSFAEPRVIKTKSGDRYFRSTATLLRVLDPQLINERDIVYHSVEEKGMSSFADVSSWFDNYGRHLGEQIETALPETEE